MRAAGRKGPRRALHGQAALPRVPQEDLAAERAADEEVGVEGRREHGHDVVGGREHHLGAVAHMQVPNGDEAVVVVFVSEDALAVVRGDDELGVVRRPVDVRDGARGEQGIVEECAHEVHRWALGCVGRDVCVVGQDVVRFVEHALHDHGLGVHKVDKVGLHGLPCARLDGDGRGGGGDGGLGGDGRRGDRLVERVGLDLLGVEESLGYRGYLVREPLMRRQARQRV